MMSRSGRIFARFARWQGGFTLLEVIVTLAMSVVLMIVISGAIQFYARDMDARNLDVRRVHLAASILQMIEDDLRSTFYSQPADLAPLETLFNAVDQQASDNSESDSSDQDATQAPLEEDEDAEGTFSEGESPFDSGVLSQPGLIGDSTRIQIDLSRAARMEEQFFFVDETNANLDDLPSDLKTVTYFVQPPGTLGGVPDSLTELTPQQSDTDAGGLVRRSLDRAATNFALSGNTLLQLNATGELIAPEVSEIFFEYWDGVDWITAWSSDQFEQLPTAVRVTLVMTAADSQEIESEQTFSHVIRLPTARRIDSSELEEDEQDVSSQDSGRGTQS